jgi:hypothetical protein
VITSPFCLRGYFKHSADDPTAPIANVPAAHTTLPNDPATPAEDVPTAHHERARAYPLESLNAIVTASSNGYLPSWIGSSAIISTRAQS